VEKSDHSGPTCYAPRTGREAEGPAYAIEGSERWRSNKKRRSTTPVDELRLSSQAEALKMIGATITVQKARINGLKGEAKLLRSISYAPRILGRIEHSLVFTDRGSSDR
jgi:hypothetical protein